MGRVLKSIHTWVFGRGEFIDDALVVYTKGDATGRLSISTAY